MAYRLTILPRSRLNLLSISRSVGPLTGEGHHRPHGRVLLCSETSVKFKSASAASPKPAPENIGDISSVSKDDVELVHHDHEAGAGPSPRSLDLSFSESEIAYRSKTTLELMRSVMVLKLCQFDFLVKYNKQLLSYSRKLLGKRLFEGLMKATFYGHFVAGEDQPSIKPKIERLNRYGVGAILDYSVEEDIPHNQAVDAEIKSCVSEGDHDVKDDEKHLKQFMAYPKYGDRRQGVSSARTYFYTDEQKCDDNLETLMECIRVAGATSDDGFCAIKLTALGRPQILLNLSEVIVRTRQVFLRMSGQEENPTVDLMSHRLTKDQFSCELETMGITSRDESGVWFTWIDGDKDGMIDLLDWECLVQPDLKLSKILKAPRIEGDKLELLQFILTEEEEEQTKRMLQRANELAKLALEKNVRVMVDAEQTYFQPAISRLTVEMMRKFNRDKPVIYNTYQCYLKHAYNCLKADMELARREGFHFGAKLVRGAYMDQERQRAEDIGYDDPINPTYEDTNESYHRCLDMSLDTIQARGQTNIMVATHNLDTVRHAVQRMEELGIGPKDRLVYFGQLLGMCDQVSFPLGEMGYAVYKYVPYGPVNDVIPYLSRRAQENSGMLKGVTQERKLMRQELTRRIRKGNIFHKP
ncbi:proline dehydrogenase 1, mitochondrial [Strongylocentrotus purpuratus]|uniref:Proline dehydrogenase n=1 Tax=Strongylocentrotus purpuratus TaxID=7668 RepID=A0A7M7PAG3_STRPU|nr:proline dehydrogenase 1, mitochondrial [Strongylocentrotus purpuratus]